MTVLLGVLLVLVCGLGGIRLLDGRRDRHAEILLSLVHLSEALGREDAATSAVLSGSASSGRHADLQRAATEIRQRLQYLSQLKMGRVELAGLAQGFADYEASAERARTAGSRNGSAPLESQVNDLRGRLDRAASHEKSTFAQYDRALDLVVVVVVALGALGAGLAAILILRERRISIGGGLQR
jgi:hypothetical protein